MRAFVVASVVSVSAALAGVGAVDARTKPAAASAKPFRFPVYDARGRAAGSAGWHVSDAGGNCCEVYVETTASGRMVEFGGEVPWVSDDRGRSWQTVEGVVPFVLGEGSGTPAPNGDVVGVIWDYSQGDRMTAYKWTAASRTWSTQEIPSRGQLNDRPYVAVVPGPFTYDGATVPYVTVINTTTMEDEVVWISGDGLAYKPSSWTLDERDAAPVRAWLDSTPNPGLDWSQGMPGSEITPFGRGAVARIGFTDDNLRVVAGAKCTTYVMRPPAPVWACFSLPRGSLPKGPMATDSRGWTHSIAWDGDELSVATTNDGGRSWHRAPVALPPGAATVVDATVRAYGRLGRVAVASHVRDAHGRSAFYVTVVDARTAVPRVLRTYRVGDGDVLLATTSGEAIQTNRSRVDFPSVAFLPDGRLAVSYADAAHTPPVLAILDRA